MRSLRIILSSAAIASVVLAALPAHAKAHRCCNGFAIWSHQHTRTYPYYNELGDSVWRSRARDAQG
jgi:hypothetical protein